MANNIQQTLKQYWGYDSFRPLQAEIIESVIAGKDTLALLPTGGGKSICFQVPALFLEGVCIVISPLIALMKDQVANLTKRGIAAEAIYSGMKYSDIDRILDNAVYGGVKLLYLSPERLTTDLALERIKQMNVNLVAVDEAHCISQWGYDFRPSYLKIADIREHLPNTPVMALTATATPEVVKDIQEKLLFEKENVLQKSFQRSNLAYVVFNEEDKLRRMCEILNSVQGTGIVYVRSRKQAQEIAIYLVKQNISATYYHAGLSSEQRSRVQELWIQNKVRVIVATNAFGMGIDKPDVRIVVHLALPESLEAYFQEAGRAGRDEKKAYAVLLYDENDGDKLRHYYQTSFPEMSVIRRVYQCLGAYYQLAVGSRAWESLDFDLTEFVDIYNLDFMTTFSSLKILEQSGWLVLTEAVYTPSSLRFVLNKEELYDYQLRNRKMDLVIKRILQSYQGAFHHYVNFYESHLARVLNVEIKEVFKSLEILAQHAVIDYRPFSEKPQLFFLQEMVNPSDLLIDKQSYDFRKKRYFEKMNKAIAYAENVVCRSQQLLRYFGENPPKCGVCDVCLGRTKVSVTKDEFDFYKNKIKEFLSEEEMSIDAIVGKFSSGKRDKVLKVLEFLEDEGVLKVEKEVLVWNG